MVQIVEEEGALVMQSSISATAIVFLQSAVLRMIPYSIPALFLIFLDLLYGVRAAKYRGEKVRTSTAVRRSVTKVFSYLCWLVLASTLALAFKHDWLEWVVLGLVYLNELTSIVGNYYEPKGLQISWRYFFNWVAKIFGQKAGVDTDGLDTGELIKPKPKPERDAKGRFVKQQK